MARILYGIIAVIPSVMLVTESRPFPDDLRGLDGSSLYHIRRSIVMQAAILKPVIKLQGIADSLTCNSCSVGLLGYCLNSKDVTCTQNSTEVCFTAASTFPSISGFNGFSSQGCTATTGCNATTNSTLLGITYETKIDCCATDKCNPVTLSGAPTTKLSLTAALGAALLASLCGTMIY